MLQQYYNITAILLQYYNNVLCCMGSNISRETLGANRYPLFTRTKFVENEMSSCNSRDNLAIFEQYFTIDHRFAADKRLIKRELHERQL